MLIRTHLTITIFGILLLISEVKYKFVFVVVALIATYIPDVDSQHSKLGHHWYFRPLQWFVKHRGMLHSFSFLILITLFLVLFIPIIALGFFLGYGLHLLADSFTLEGIKPFYPLEKKSSWKIRTGGRKEITLFVIFIILDLFLVFWKISRVF